MFGTTDGAGLYGSGLVEAGQDLGHAPVGHQQLPGIHALATLVIILMGIRLKAFNSG